LHDPILPHAIEKKDKNCHCASSVHDQGRRTGLILVTCPHFVGCMWTTLATQALA
jgi:hypothetical protein